jgi:hypothetical protein
MRASLAGVQRQATPCQAWWAPPAHELVIVHNAERARCGRIFSLSSSNGLLLRLGPCMAELLVKGFGAGSHPQPSRSQGPWGGVSAWACPNLVSGLHAAPGVKLSSNSLSLSSPP